MTAAADAIRPVGPALKISRASLVAAALWLLVFSGSIVKIEPSPYEAVFPFACLALLVAGARMHRALAPMIVALALFNLGGLIGLVPWLDWQPGVMFILISIYMGATTIFFACALLDDTERRLAAIRSAYIWTAVFAAILGVVGYFADDPLHELLTRFDRATGAFKDPNVFGPFLIAPAVWLADDLLRGGEGARAAMARAAALALIMTALFLTFSRGAWIAAAGTLALCVALRFAVGASRAMRQRIVLLSLLGLAALIGLLSIAVSIPAVREVFVERASLDQAYDLGELGRFGAQLRSIPLLLESPLGFGPLRFHIVIGNEDPHNVYVNAFASYGWLGGLAYLALIGMTLFVGWRLALRPGPFRSAAIPIWAALFLQILQGVQIDTDHWRHLYLLIGVVWGLGAASAMRERRAAPHLRATEKA
ncbi:MAG: O-antigen ligase family protein [Methylobacteriaceae bacterium]|nr:O-antigen ligase family protein [Methylobacteriaceae bacterium]